MVTETVAAAPRSRVSQGASRVPHHLVRLRAGTGSSGCRPTLFPRLEALGAINGVRLRRLVTLRSEAAPC